MRREIFEAAENESIMVAKRESYHGFPMFEKTKTASAGGKYRGSRRRRSFDFDFGGSAKVLALCIITIMRASRGRTGSQVKQVKSARMACEGIDQELPQAKINLSARVFLVSNKGRRG